MIGRRLRSNLYAHYQDYPPTIKVGYHPYKTSWHTHIIGPHKLTILVHDLSIIFLKIYFPETHFFRFSIHPYFLNSVSLHDSPLLEC